MMAAQALPKKRRPKRPGEIIVAEFLRPLGRTQQDLARALDTDRARVNAILTGRRTMTLDIAMRLEKVLGPSALFWMTLQLRFDLWNALNDPDAHERIEDLQPLTRGFRKRRIMNSRLTWEPRGNPWHAREADV